MPRGSPSVPFQLYRLLHNQPSVLEQEGVCGRRHRAGAHVQGLYRFDLVRDRRGHARPQADRIVLAERRGFLQGQVPSEHPLEDIHRDDRPAGLDPAQHSDMEQDEGESGQLQRQAPEHVRACLPFREEQAILLRCGCDPQPSFQIHSQGRFCGLAHRRVRQEVPQPDRELGPSD